MQSSPESRSPRIAALCLLTLAPGAWAQTNQAGMTWELTGGRWFDGQQFSVRTLYIVDGQFTAHRPAAVDTTLDLTGKWIVPPYGEAHNHNLEDSRLDAVVAANHRTGVFYQLNPNAIPRFGTAARALASKPGTIDGAFAQGGWTGPGGHPVELFERNLRRGIFGEGDGEGAFFRVVSKPDEVDVKWDDFLADDPDIVKVYLLYSEEARDALPYGWTGLDPDVLPAIIGRAHASGLRVTAHVETAADFRTAVTAGVDQIAHLPGFRPRPDGRAPDLETHGLTEADARLAFERGIDVVTTASFVSRADGAPAAMVEQWRVVVLHNLAVLRDAGVPLAVGSDDYGRTSRAEAEWLASLDLFSNAEVLRMWSITTPRAIFPERRIGIFEEGWEASFLVLDSDPLADFEATRDIALRFKQGRPVDVAAPEPSETRR